MYTHPQHNGGEEIMLLRQEAGKWLKRLRENRGLSQSELASKLGVDYYNFISQIEAGRSRVPPDRYEAWAEAMDMDAHLFVRKLMQFYDPITYKIIYSQETPLSAN
jgi:transcriptional regulator with XRE-family HTH domain